ncbi:MAG: hypothetical protein ABW352_07540 [Polyangiales bacterium]
MRLLFSLWLAVGSVVGVGCEWQPIAREVAPELVLAGPARVSRLIDSEGRNALVSIGAASPFTLHIVRLDTRESCALPAGSVVPWFVQPLVAPNLRGKDARAFLLPVFKRDGEQLNLYYTDEKCGVLGPFGETLPGDLGMLQLRSDSRNVSLVRDSKNTLRLVDPWSNKSTQIAERVTAYVPVQRSDASGLPESLWLVEDRKLTQRALDGTLLLTLGSDVGDYFVQTLRDQLRVAYVDRGNLYEAKGPSFAPVLIAEDACSPSYQDNALDLHMPCADEQLVRIDLTTGAIRRFAPKVFRSYTASELTFELAREKPDPDDYNLYVAEGLTGMKPRALLDPRPNSGVSVIARQRMVGLSVDAQLGIWSLDGKFTAGYRGVQRLQTFRDQRTGQLLWLVAYAVDSERVATVGVIDQRQLEAVVASIELDAGVPGTSDASVPAARPLVVAERAHRDGYRVFYPSAVHEPVILTLEPPITVIDPDPDNFVFSGALHAHLLSAEESTRVDDDVVSYEIVQAPLPGIIYGILQGPRAGLWFAAL